MSDLPELSAEALLEADANWRAFVAGVTARLRALERDPMRILEEVRDERRLRAVTFHGERPKYYGVMIPDALLSMWGIGEADETAAEFVERWQKVCKDAEDFAARTRRPPPTTGPVLTEDEWRWLYTRPFPTPEQIAERFDGHWLKLFAAFNDRPRGVSDETPPIYPAIVRGHLVSVLNAAVAHCNALPADDEQAEVLFAAIAAMREWQAELTRYLPPPMPPRWGGPGYVLGGG